MANKIFKGIKFPEMDDYYIIPETDKSLSVEGSAADAAAVGEALSNKASESFVLAKIAEAQLNGSEVDLSGYLTKENPAGTGSLSMNRKADSTIGTHSTTLGINNIASGSASHAEGGETCAYGHASHTEGAKTVAKGNHSHAEGYQINAWGDSAHAEGTAAQSNLPPSLTENSLKEEIIAYQEQQYENDNGFSLAKGEASHTEGYSTLALDSYAHAEGYYTIAAGINSHAEGNYSFAIGPDAHAEGSITRATGRSSHTEGVDTNASGGAAHAEGYTTIASAMYSHAEGFNTSAEGAGSHAEGCGTIATRDASHAGGQYNIANSDYLVVIGNGTSDTARSNAHTLDSAGNAWFKGDIYVGGTGQDDDNAIKVCTENDLGVYATKVELNEKVNTTDVINVAHGGTGATTATAARIALGAASTSIATTSMNGLMSSSDKSKLDGIATGANKYTLPNATSSTLGGVKVGSNITVSSGTISLTKANVTSALGYTPPASASAGMQRELGSSNNTEFVKEGSTTAVTFPVNSGVKISPKGNASKIYIVTICSTTSDIIRASLVFDYMAVQNTGDDYGQVTLYTYLPKASTPTLATVTMKIVNNVVTFYGTDCKIVHIGGYY